LSPKSASSLNQQKNELQSQLEAQKEKQKHYNALIAEAKKDVSKQSDVVRYLYAEMNTYQEQLSTISALILEYNKLAEEKKKEIDDLNARIDSNYEIFKERLIFSQESGEISYIDFILGSSELSDVLSRSEVIGDMLEYDKKIIESLISDRSAVESAKAEIEIALQATEEKKTEMDALIVTLQQKQAEAERELSRLKNDQDRYSSALKAVEDEKKKTEKELQAVMDRIAAQSAAKPGPTGFTWPLPVATPGYITQNFGNNGHRGVDIGVGGWAYNGKIPALAVAAGKVVECTNHYSWGKYVLIDHGGGYVTRYAHLDSFSVSLGQTVTRGQQVGKIGSTGNSTGPHLHLELMAPVGAGGKSILTNPMKYLVKP
jgi:murein DD-endopeptidase MepM/ murein hydrolase activator NlpD